MIDRLALGETAYFYKYNKKISKKKMKDAFVDISKNKKGNYIENVIKQKKNINGCEVLFSLCSFEIHQRPSFLRLGDEREVKIAYILVVEYKDHLIINRRNVVGFEKYVEKNIEELDYNLLSRLFVNEDARIEKFTLNSMDISNNVVRKKNFEAINLKESYSTFGANKSIINAMRVNDSGHRYSLALSSSRINEMSSKVNFDEFVLWGIEITNKIDSYVASSNYLDHFAKPLKFRDYINVITPNNILILLSDFKREDFIDEIYIKKGAKTREIGISKLLDAFETVKAVTVIDPTRKKYYKIDNSFDKTLKLSVNPNSITLSSNKLKNITVKFCDGTEKDLLSFINKTQDYIVGFDNFDMVYRSRKLFKDSNLLGNLDYFLNVFIPDIRLNGINSEKGSTNIRSSKFNKDSLFGYLETSVVPNADYLFCDDMGNEWADYISVAEEKNVMFYHCKHSSLSFSASKFHEVVSQAQKNIGNLYPNIDELNRKKEKWDAYYTKTKIKRMRKGNNIDEAVKIFYKTMMTPNTEKGIYLVVDFISKTELENELNILKGGINKPKNETIQILWLLTSLVFACKESNVNVYITCQP